MKNSEKWTGRGVGVAVLDTGAFPHIDFDRRIRCFRDFVEHKERTYDDNGHGTHVAGIIGGSGKGSGGRCRGMAPECHFVICKVLDYRGNGQKEVLLNAFRWILAHYSEYHVRVVNISVGTTCNTPQERRILSEGADELWNAGLIVVAAAGNQGPRPGSVTAPGNSRKVITVGSSDMLTGSHGSSGRGPTEECVCKPDIVAPGFHILSCAPSADGRAAYVRKSGTSMSTPLISGSIAQILQKNPSLTNLEVKRLIRECAHDLSLPHNMQGWGLFDRERFLELQDCTRKKI